jgi:hypothetical protein
MKSLIYKIKLQTVAEITGHVFSVAAQKRNDSIMPCRATNSLLKRVGNLPKRQQWPL